ncbi:MAG: hypothetical protein K5851_02275 [Lachnospiraceae bacterium]|nr:hypothetical protein [Lachnospiraceae bacterium]
MAERDDLIRGLADAMKESTSAKRDAQNSYDPATGTFYIQGNKITKEIANAALDFFEKKSQNVASTIVGREERMYYDMAIASIKKCLIDDDNT